MAVQLLDLKAQYKTIKKEMEVAVTEVIESQIFINGPIVEKFEKEIAEYCNSKYAIGVSSGSDAVLVALMALDIKRGDEVITTPYTFFATAGAISRLGARPVFVDVCYDTYNINPELIEAKITPQTKAIIPVHLYGQSADMDPILAIAKKHGLAVIEDGAQAIGSKYKGKTACTLGEIGTLSFFPSKNLGGFGDGGMVLTNSKDLYEKIKKLRNHGSSPKYYHSLIGGNFRLDALQAGVLSVKLRHLDSWSNKRRENAEYYKSRFVSNSKIKLPEIREENTTIFNQFVICVENRDELMANLKARSIGCEIYYPVPLHLQECYKNLGYKEGDMPVSEKSANTSIAIPIYPELSKEELCEVADAVLEFVN